VKAGAAIARDSLKGIKCRFVTSVPPNNKLCMVRNYVPKVPVPKVPCDKCGKTKSIGFDDLGELHLRYLKGLSGPYSVETSEHDQYIKNHTSLQPISEEDYYKGINAIAGKCRCRGKYTLDAPPRCPKCHSTRIEEGETTIMYD